MRSWRAALPWLKAEPLLWLGLQLAYPPSMSFVNFFFEVKASKSIFQLRSFCPRSPGLWVTRMSAWAQPSFPPHSLSRARAALKKKLEDTCGTCTEHGCLRCSCAEG